MKKLSKRKEPPVSGAQPDMSGLVMKMHEQLVSMERKLDSLMSRVAARPAVEINPPRSFHGPERNLPVGGDGRQDNKFANRVMHKAICADCNKECEVPFKPSQDRPVYCKECFSKRKNGSPFNVKADLKAVRHAASVVHAAAKPKIAVARKAAEKKKPQARKKR